MATQDKTGNEVTKGRIENVRQELVGYELPPERAAGEIVESVDELIEKLVNEAKAI